MSGINADTAAAYLDSDNSRKRARQETQDTSYEYYYSNEECEDESQLETPAKHQQAPERQPTKIRLSLKLGALKQQPKVSLPGVAAPTSNYHEDDGDGDADNDYYDGDDMFSDDGSVDIDDAEYTPYKSAISSTPDSFTLVPPPPPPPPRSIDVSTQTPAAASHQPADSDGHTPRIKLRFSFNKKPTDSQTKPAQTTIQNSDGNADTLDILHPQVHDSRWRSAYNTHEHTHPHAVAGSVVPTSPSDSVVSNDSSVYPRRISSIASFSHTGRGMYSPSRASDVDSDDNRHTRYNESDIEGHTYEHTAAFSIAGASGNIDSAANASYSSSINTVPRKRGRPPLRGRGSANIKQARTPASRKPSSTFTTTVSLRSSLERLVKRIKKRDSYGFFLEPVDTNVITDYLSIIKSPMDLGTMQKKVHGGVYTSIDEFKQDLLLVCENARKYNGDGSIYAKSADRVQEYALKAIEGETTKLERVGMASLPMDANASTASHRSLYQTPQAQSYSQPRSRSATPTRDVGVDEHSDAGTGGFYAGDFISEFRRSSRLRWRGASEVHAHTPGSSSANMTPSSIADNFKWTGGSRKKYKKHSQMPKRITESQVKVSVLADGSIDPTGFEDDIALVPFAKAWVALPLIAGSRSAPPTATTSKSTVSYPIFANGCYYLPATSKDFGPYQAELASASSGSGSSLGRISSNLQNMYGDSVGLAYWSSICGFVEGAGDNAADYVTKVLDHLTGGAHTVARNTVNVLRNRKDKEIKAASRDLPTSELGRVDVSEIVGWLEHQPVRDQLFAQRVNALTTPVYLRDISLNKADTGKDEDAAEPDTMSELQKQELYEQNTQKIKGLYESYENGSSVAATPAADELQDSLYKVAKKLCASHAGSAKPSSAIPGLAAANSYTSLTPQGYRGTTSGPGHSASTPSLPAAIHPASLASAVRSDLINDLDRGSTTSF